jgi:site-specific DNA recombinase
VSRAIFYLRVSSLRQAETDFDPEGLSLPTQRGACRRKAKELDAVIVDEYIDRGESAKSAHRPALQALIHRITTQHDVEYVIVYNVSRWARNLDDDVVMTMLIRKAGAQLVSATENIDNTPMGRLVHAIMAGVSEYNISVQARDILGGLLRKAETGGTPHMAPTGYLHNRTFVEGREVRTVALDAERAPLVHWAFEIYATGEYSVRQLTDMLEARGLTTRPTPKTPSKALCRSKVAHMLHNRYYIGTVVYKGVEYPNARHDAIVSPDLFERVQQVLQAHDQAGERARTHNHYLKGSLRCGRCGSAMLVTNARGKTGRRYLYYFCALRHRSRGCQQRYVLAEVMEQEVLAQYERQEQRLRMSAEDREALEKMLRAELEGERRQQELTIRRHHARLGRLELERAKLLQAHYADAIPLGLLKQEQDRITRHVNEIQRQLEASKTGYASTERAIFQALDLMARCHQTYCEASRPLRRALNQVLWEHFRVEEGGVEDGQLVHATAAVVAYVTDRQRVIRQRRRAARGAVRMAILSSCRGLNKDRLVEPRGFEPRTSAVRVQRFGDDLVCGVWAVVPRAVEDPDAELRGTPHHANCLVAVGGRARDPGPGQAHGAEPHPGDDQVAESDGARGGRRCCHGSIRPARATSAAGLNAAGSG